MKKEFRAYLSGLLLVGSLGVQAAEDSLYDFHWLDPDKAVYVLQNKVHKKEGTFFIDLAYVANQTATFQDTSGILLTPGYFWHEEWGVELLYLKYQNQNNSAFRNVRVVNSSVPYVRRHDQTIGLGVVWSPFYGKVNAFNEIYYFDWSISGGVAQITTEQNLNSAVNNLAIAYDTETDVGLYLKSQIKFHLSEAWHLGVGYLGSFYRAPGARGSGDNLEINSDFLFQVGWSH
jgi:outer membrane beta-barrel protein